MGKNATHMSINDDNVIDHKISSYNLLIYLYMEMFREVYSRCIKSQLKYGGKIVLILLDHELKKSQIVRNIYCNAYIIYVSILAEVGVLWQGERECSTIRLTML
jgi:hypothetical protein